MQSVTKPGPPTCMMRCLLQNRACVFFSSGRLPSLPSSHRPSVAVVLLRLLSALYGRSLLAVAVAGCVLRFFVHDSRNRWSEIDRSGETDAPTGPRLLSITVVTEKYRSHVFPMADHVLVEISVTRILGVDSWRGEIRARMLRSTEIHEACSSSIYTTTRQGDIACHGPP